MEFTYRISEAEYLSSLKLKFKRTARVGTVAFFFFGVLIILFCLTLVFRFNSRHSIRAIIVILVPCVLYIGFMVYLIFGLLPKRLRLLYRKSPTLQGQFKVNISPESLSIENSAGSSSKTDWKLFDFWFEEQDLLMLKFRSGAHAMMNLAGISDAQKDEVRGILTAALPKK